jgi:hypothetical protein
MPWGSNTAVGCILLIARVAEIVVAERGGIGTSSVSPEKAKILPKTHRKGAWTDLS